MAETVTFEFSRGDHIKHKITNWEGVIVVQACWLNGCRRYGVQPIKLEKDGKMGQTENLDEGEIVLVKKAKAGLAATLDKPPGGPQRGESRAMAR